MAPLADASAAVASTSDAEAGPSVDELLILAYGEEEVGKTGHELAGHAVEKADVEILMESGQGSSLLYGELLPAGVERLAAALFEGKENLGERSSGAVLELGMGTGKAALQLFLSLRKPVYGVELAPSRFDAADAAIRRLAEALPESFRYEPGSCSGAASLLDLRRRGSSDACEAPLRFDIVCGSMFDTPSSLLESAAGIVMEVCLPKEAQRLACGLLQRCPTGCRAVCYAPLHGLVGGDEEESSSAGSGCRLAPVEPGDRSDGLLGDGAGGLRLLTSWNSKEGGGHGFAFYELAASAEVARERWAATAAASPAAATGRVKLDKNGNPSRGRHMKYTDAVLVEPRGRYEWSVGDKVLVGWSWLPFFDLGNPDDGSCEGLDGVTWMAAWITAVSAEGYATLCYEADGTIEESVHPERIRKEGCYEKRGPVDIDWGDDGDVA